jgi:pimeloyl-ACP methyl ester carboxylesterase
VRRRGFLALALAIPACALLYQGLAGPFRALEGLRHLGYLPMGFSLLLTFAFFNFTEHNSRQRYSGFPHRLFTLPVPTRLLVACPMLCGMLTVAAVYAAWSWLVFRPIGAELPYRWPAALLVTGMACYQAVIWGLAGFRLVRIVSLGLVLSGLVAVGFLPDVLGPRVSWPLEIGLTWLLAAAVLAAYLTAVLVVDRQRHGGLRGITLRLEWARRVAEALPHRPARPFASRARAQAWIEWRQQGLVLPVCVAFVLLLIVGPVSWMNGTGPRTTVVTLAWILALPVLLAGLVGLGFSKPDFWSGDLALAPLVATRPVAAAEIVIAKLKAGALSTILTWGILLAITGYWLNAHCDTKYLADIATNAYKLFGPARLVAVVGLALITLIVLTWRLLLVGLPAALSGRGRAFLLTALSVLAGVLAAVRIGYDPALVSGRVQSVLPRLPWALALLFVAKCGTACGSFLRAIERRLMSKSLVARYVVFWLAATGMVVAFPVLLFADVPWLRDAAALGALSLVPLARVGRSALALEQNRHRGPVAHRSCDGPFGSLRATSVAVLLGVCLPSASFLLAARVSAALPRQVDAGGHNVRMLVAGAGPPTVILESSGMAPLESWSRVQPAVSRFARVVSYDHAGYWGSQSGPKPRDARQIARELHAALASAQIAPPYVLVGYSFGGPFVRVFADLYPGEVAGLVLVDPSQEAAFDWVWAHHPEVNRITEVEAARQDEWGCSRASLKQARASRRPDVPVTLITCLRHDNSELARETMPIWVDAHRNWLAGIPGARHIVTGRAGHGIIFEEPELVVETIREMVDLVSGRRPAR